LNLAKIKLRCSKYYLDNKVVVALLALKIFWGEFASLAFIVVAQSALNSSKV
jgi:hypothetical protein